MTDFSFKKKYDPPRVVSVSFKVEDGFVGSNTILGILPPDISNSNLYSEAANSGSSFWGGTNDNSHGQTGGYTGFDWNW